ncbi:MAG: hypothetical protein IPO83_14275 [Chitinophagaceae bacterium]|nr:hypothetical protein [Chitinophagaceae bacterium]
MIKRKLTLFILIVSAICVQHNACAQDKTIQVSGWGIDSISKRPIINLQLINKRTQERFFSDNAGYFRLTTAPEDSIFVVATGYSSKTISFRDSLSKEKYLITIFLNKIQIELPNIEVQSNREFELIHRDALRLGYNKKDYELHGYQVLQSPFTALYQQFSNREKDKRGYAELMNKVHQRELQREILQKYIDNDVIPLKPDEISSFLDYCDIPEYMLKTGLEYDIVLYMKSKYFQFIRQ